MSVSCPYTPDDISAYVDGEQGEADCDGLSHHLQHCATCANMAASFGLVSAALRATDRVTAPSDLLAAVMSRVKARRPPRALSCEAAQEAMSAYVDAELPARAAERLEAHLFACAGCARDFELLHLCSTGAHLPIASPIGLRRRILAAVAQPAPPPKPGFAEALLGQLRPRALAPALVAAAAVVLALAFHARLGFEPDERIALPAPGAYVDEPGPGAASPGVGPVPGATLAPDVREPAGASDSRHGRPMRHVARRPGSARPGSGVPEGASGLAPPPPPPEPEALFAEPPTSEPPANPDGTSNLNSTPAPMRVALRPPQEAVAAVVPPAGEVSPEDPKTPQSLFDAL